jgi:hypothetical protein
MEGAALLSFQHRLARGGALALASMQPQEPQHLWKTVRSVFNAYRVQWLGPYSRPDQRVQQCTKCHQMRVVGKRNRDLRAAYTYEQIVERMRNEGLGDPGPAPLADCASLSPSAPDPMPARERRYWTARDRRTRRHRYA